LNKMIASTKKMSRVLIPLALAVFGLALVVLVLSGLPVTPVRAAPEGPVLQVSATNNAEPPVRCNDTFTVTATISNTGDQTAVGTTAVIAWSPASAFATTTTVIPPSAATGFDLSPDAQVDVEWGVKCLEPGTGIITVTAEAENAAPASGTTSVTQHHLDVRLEAEPTACVNGQFSAIVEVENLACTGHTATVTPTLSVTGDAIWINGPFISDTVAAGATVQWTASFSCTGTTDAVLQASADGYDEDEDKVIPPELIYDADAIATVDQQKAHLVVSLDAPEKVQVGHTFTVEVTVENTGDVTANDVAPTLVEVEDGEVDHVEGPIPDKADIGPGLSQVFVYTYTCTAEGDVVFKVTDVAGRDGCTGDDIPDDNIDLPDPITVSQEYIVFGVEILEPSDGEHVVESQVFDLQAVFTTTPPIVVTTPTHEELKPDIGTLTEAVYAELEYDPTEVEIVEYLGPDMPFRLDDNEEGKKAVWWRLHCLKPDVETTITVRGYTATGIEVSKSVTVIQFPGHPRLEAKIIKPRVTQKYVSQSFSVVAEITNTGGEPAYDVEATIDLGTEGLFELLTGEDATKVLGKIPPGETHEAVWTVHCAGPGVDIITVTPSGVDDVSGAAIPADMITADSIEIEQVPKSELDVEFVSPTPSNLDKIGFEAEFTIMAEIENTGFGTVSDIFTPTLGFAPDDAIEIVGGPFEEDCETELDVPFELEKDASKKVCWKVKCARAEAEAGEIGTDQWLLTTFWVTASGISNICDCEVGDFDTETIIQKYLIVEILWPEDSHWFRESDEWMVSFRVTPYGYSMSGATAKISVEGPLEIIGLDEVEIGDVSTAGKDFEKFHVHCAGPGDGTITIEVTGITANPIAATYTNSDQVTVHQSKYPPVVWGGITDPITSTWYSPGEEFTVMATIVALPGYRPPAENITVTLHVVGNAEIVDAATKDVADLSPGESAEVSWVVVGTGPCDVDLWVEVYWEDPTSGLYEGYTASSDEVTVHEFPLKTTIVQFPNEVESGATFDIHAKIESYDCDWYTCENCGIPDVYATIEIIEGRAELAPGEVADKYIGTVITPREYAQEAEWTVQCLGPGTVKIRVTAWTETNPFTGESLDKRLVATSDIVIVNQIPREIGYEIQLCKHWNYMSLPLIPVSKDIGDVLASIEPKVVDVWAWDAENEEWQVYVPGAGYEFYDYAGLTMLTEMEDGRGYIIRMMYPDILKGEGYEDPPPDAWPPEQLEYDLAQGWNLVGFKTRDFAGTAGMIDDADVMDAGWYLRNLNTCAQCADAVVGDEARFLRTYVCGYPGEWDALLDDTEDMEPGQGYWLYASLPDLSIVPPITQGPP
jgi:hypothetical protein